MENNLSRNPYFHDLPDEIKKENRYISKVFFTFAIAYVISLGFLLTINAFLYAVDISEKADYIIRSIISASHTPLIFLLMYIGFKKISSAPHPRLDKMNAQKLICFLCVCVFLMILGSVVGNFFTKLVCIITGKNQTGIVSDIVKSMKPLEVFILAVIMGPIFEELVFRKLLIDKLARYGTVFASVVSALVFGLYHGNFEQFFYAFFVGIILSYVYCVYGSIIYPVVLHVVLNAIGSFIPLIIGLGETSEITSSQTIYMYLYILSFFTGGFIFVSKFRQSLFNLVEGCLIRPWMVLIKNPGFIFTVVISLLMFAYNLI